MSCRIDDGYSVLMPLRGKEFDQLNPSQQRRVEKNFDRYMKSLKGRKTPDMEIREFLPILQKQAMTYLIMAIVILPIYAFFLYFFASYLYL